MSKHEEASGHLLRTPCEICGPIKESSLEIHFKSISHLIKTKKSNSGVINTHQSTTEKANPHNKIEVDNEVYSNGLDDITVNKQNQTVGFEDFFDNPLKKFEVGSTLLTQEQEVNESNEENDDMQHRLELDDAHKINELEEEAYLREKMLQSQMNIIELDYYDAITQVNSKAKGVNSQQLLNKKRLNEIKFESNLEDPSTLIEFLDDLF